MPLYRYICNSCQHEFELLVMVDHRNDQECTLCGEKAVRDISSGFSVSTPIDPNRKVVSTAKDIDQVVGKDAEEKWEFHDKRTKERRVGMQEIDLGNVKGKINPVSLLGDEKQKKLMDHYSEGLAAHREERARKGLKQFEDQN